MASVNKPAIRVKVDIRPGSPSQAQLAAWRRFWAKIIADTNHDRVESHTSDAMKEVNSEKHK